MYTTRCRGWLSVHIASVLGLGVRVIGLVGPMEPPVGPVVFLLSLCLNEKAVIHLSLAHASSLYRQRTVIHWLKAMCNERDKML